MAKSFKQTVLARCSKITSDINKVNGYIHETGMMIIGHAAPEALNGHGDCELALNLALAMPASMRREMLIVWLKKYTPIIVKLSEHGNSVGFDPKYKALKPSDKATATRTDGTPWWNIDGANAEPFWQIAEATPEKPALTFEAAMKLIEGLSKRLTKQVEDGKADEKDKDAILALSVKLGGVRVKRDHGSVSNDEATGDETLAA
jgi:hypothetical protein